MSSYKCLCGKDAWVEVDKQHYCRRCYLRLRGKEHILDFERATDGKEKEGHQ